MGDTSRKTQNAIHQAVTEKNKIKLLTYIAISLHAVQDFYSPSNWVEMHERVPWMPYRTDTWYNSPAIAQTLSRKSGHHPSGSAGGDDHGNYMYGINHDGAGPSATRSRFDEAYVFAYVASLEWLRACKQWADEVDTAFWAQAQTIPVTPALQADIDLDLQALYRLSEWAGSGGHWKGPGSEYLGGFIDFSANWISSMSQFKGPVQKQQGP